MTAQQPQIRSDLELQYMKKALELERCHLNTDSLVRLADSVMVENTVLNNEIGSAKWSGVKLTLIVEAGVITLAFILKMVKAL